MRKLWIAALAVCLMLAASGCGSTDQQQTAAPTKGDAEKIELKFLTWGNQAHLDVYNGLADEYAKLHPNVKVAIDSVPFPEYQQKISVLAAGRELPDIAWTSERMVPQFMENDILEDVSDLSNDDSFGMNDFIPSTLELFRKGDKLYGVPFSTPPTVMFYNKSAFEKAGLQLPNELAKQGKWTWDEFVKTAKTLTNGTGANKTYGANFFRDWKTWILLSSYSWSNGSGPFNKEMTDFTWDDQYGVGTFKMLQQMMFVDGSHPKAGEQISFESGKIGMFFDVYSFVSKARAIKDFEWSIAPMPSGSQGSVPMLGQAGYVVFKDSKHPQEAKDFLKFLASKDGIQKTSTFFVPPRQSVLKSDEFMKQPNNPAPEDIQQAVIDEMPKARFQPGHVQWQKIDTEILSGFDQLFGQIAEPEQIVKTMAEKVRPLLGK